MGTSLGTLNTSASNDIGRNNTSENQLSKMPENNSETTTRERISPMTEATENTKRAAKKSVETARVIEGIDILGTEKCSCTATDQVPVLVLDKLKKNGNFEKMNEEVEVKIFKAGLDLDHSSSNSDPEVNDKRNEIPRDKPFRLPLTSIRCSGFNPKMTKEEEVKENKKEKGNKELLHPKVVEKEDKSVVVNGSVFMEASRTIPYKVNHARPEGEEPQRVMVTVPYKMPVRIHKDDGELPVPLNYQALPYQLRHSMGEVPQPVPRSVALEGEMSSGARPITS